MSRRLASGFALGSLLLIVALALTSLALTPATPAGAVRSSDKSLMPGLADFAHVGAEVTFGLVVALIVWRRANLVGVLLCAIGVAYAAGAEFTQRYLAAQ